MGSFIQPIKEKMRGKHMLHYTPHTSVAVDESTIFFKGSVFQSMQLVKSDLEVSVLSVGANYCVYNFMPYTKKSHIENTE
jgi:hypothetical protein